MNENPLLSIIVITYNSSEFLLQTLESITDQKYNNIEVIISDDGSKDDTIDICENWLQQNNKKFVSSEIITVEHNTGIPANCNRGIKAAKGSWIKLIAGDDAFTTDGIRQFIGAKKSNAHIFQTVGEIYKNEFLQECFLGKSGSSSTQKFFELNSNYQFNLLKYWNYLSAPSIFFRAEIFDSISFDEEYKKVEDYPFWIIATKNGYHIEFIDIITVKYRIHGNSVQNFSEVNSFLNAKSKYALTNKIRAKYYDHTFLVRFYHFIILNLSTYHSIRKIVNKVNLSFRFFATYLSSFFFRLKQKNKIY